MTEDWTELLVDARAVRAVYGVNPPSLANLTMHELCLHRDGPRAVLHADIAGLPENPPKKWRDRGFNTVRIELWLEGVSDANITGIATDSRIDLRLTREKGQIHAIAGPGSTTTFDIWSDSVILNSVSAYHSSPVVAQRAVVIEALAQAAETPWAFVVRCVTGEIEPGTEFHNVVNPDGTQTPAVLRVSRILRFGQEADLLDAPNSATLVLTGKTGRPPGVGDKLVG
jgi:hypothetical protein